jgi:hypothetical protein
MNKFLIIVASFFLSGCASAHAVKHVETSAVVSHQPVTIKVWVDGRWIRHGHHAHKASGHWVTRPAPHRPGPRSAWAPGHYNHHGSGCQVVGDKALRLCYLDGIITLMLDLPY